MKIWVAGLASVSAAVLLPASSAIAAPSEPSALSASGFSPCTLKPGPVRTVARVLDGETLVLDDGSAVRLIGALAPRARDAGAEPGAWPPEIQSIKMLSSLVLGKKVRLAFGGRQKDRYGRHLAQVFVVVGGREEWVQGTMLSSGQARSYGLPESFACARELLAHEAEARRKRLGLWSNGVYRPMPADQPGALMKLRGKYQRVIGSIASIGRTKSTTYLNFGTDWRTDFTVRISKNVLSAHPDFSGTLDALQSKTLIVRGWIERRNGPLIDVADPSQIEVLDEGVGSGEAPSISAVPAPVGPQSASAPSDAQPLESMPENLRPAPTEGAEPGAVDL